MGRGCMPAGCGPVFWTDPGTLLPKDGVMTPWSTLQIIGTPASGMLMGDCDTPDEQVPLKPFAGPNGCSWPAADTRAHCVKLHSSSVAVSAEAVQLQLQLPGWHVPLRLQQSPKHDD